MDTLWFKYKATAYNKKLICIKIEEIEICPPKTGADYLSE